MTRMTRHDARRILDGRDRSGRLGALLDAAAAPARPGELRGEDDALTAFRTAPRVAVRPRRSFLARFVVVKAVIAVALLGGVALAASASLSPGGEGGPGTPVASGGRADPAPNTPVAPAGSPTPTPPGPTDGADAGEDGGRGEDGHDGAGDPGKPSAKRLAQLCRMYLDDPRAAEAEKDYPGLEKRAGGLDRVRRFCERLLSESGDEGDGPQDGTSPSPRPSKSHGHNPGSPDMGAPKSTGLTASTGGTAEEAPAAEETPAAPVAEEPSTMDTGPIGHKGLSA